MVARPILATILCSAALAHGSPRSDPTAGRAVFTGATLPNATSIDVNPAALGTGTFGELFAALTGVLDQIRIDRRDLDGQPVPDGSVRTTEITPGGTLALVVRTGNYTLGFAAHTPPAERFPVGEALRYHSRGGWQRDYLATIAGSIRVTRSFFIGAHLAHANTLLRLRYSRDSALDRCPDPTAPACDCAGAACGFENPAAEERYDVDVRSPWVSGGNLKVTIGLAAQLYPGVWLGVAYHTPPGFAIQSELEGDVDVVRAPRDRAPDDPGLVRGGSSVYVQYPASIDAEVRARLPRQLELHVGGRWEDLSRFGAYDVRAYNSTFAANGIPEWTLRPRALHDSLALWAGVETPETGQALRYGARLGFETAAVDARALSPLTIAPASLTLDAGVQARIASSDWRVQLTYGLAYFPTVGVTDSAFDPRLAGACAASGHDYSTPACAAARSGFAIPTAAGDYGRLQHALQLGLRYELP